MTEYKLDARFFSMLRRRTLLISTPFLLFAVGLGIYVGVGLGPGLLLCVLLPTILLTLIAAGIGGFWGMRIVERSWASFRIVLDEDGVTRRQDRVNLRILYSQITRIYAERSGLTIRTADRFRFIAVPRLMERFDDLSVELARHHPIEDLPHRMTLRYWALLIGELVFGLAVVLAFFLARDHYVAIAASIGMLLIAAFSVAVRRKGLLTVPNRFLFWFSMALIALMAIGRMALAILGY